jgi:hypothetical protein
MLSEKEKNDLRQKIQSNKHEVYVISMEEMDAIIRSSPKGSKKSVKDAWKKIKDKVGVGAGYYSSATDAVTMSKLVGDLGGFGAKAYIKTYGGKPHIILKGHPGLRNILTGTKYGIKNPKVVTMGLGKTGAIAAARQGGILTIVLLSAYRVADYFLSDQATLSQLVGTLATDIVKVGIVTGASILMATIAGAATFAVGPILAVVVIGFGLSYLLEKVDNSLGITERVIAGLDELGDNFKQYVADKKQQAKNVVDEAADSVIEYVLESASRVVIRWVQGKLNEYLSPLPRVR